MAETKPSKVVVEPNDRVVKALKLAVAGGGVDEFLRRTSATSKLLERWINGEEWVPVNVVMEACDVNRNNPEIPSYFKIFYECTEGASFKVMVEKEVEKPTAPVVKEIMPPTPRVQEEKLAEPKAKELNQKVVRQMVKVGTALLAMPILSVGIGFLLGGFTGAVVGAVLSFVIIMILTFMFFVFRPRKSRRIGTDARSLICMRKLS